MSERTTIEIYKNGTFITVAIADLDNDTLLEEYAAEWESSSRTVSGDPADHIDELREEILRRMAK